VGASRTKRLMLWYPGAIEVFENFGSSRNSEALSSYCDKKSRMLDQG
jgi:uncharacterized membrane protein YccC